MSATPYNNQVLRQDVGGHGLPLNRSVARAIGDQEAERCFGTAGKCLIAICAI